MRLRAVPQVMRIHNSKKKEGHEQHYSELLLLGPLLFAHWRNETEEFHEDSMEDCMKEYESRIKEIKKQDYSLSRRKCN